LQQRKKKQVRLLSASAFVWSGDFFGHPRFSEEDPEQGYGTM
jgi:hypothetical protein